MELGKMTDTCTWHPHLTLLCCKVTAMMVIKIEKKTAMKIEKKTVMKIEKKTTMKVKKKEIERKMIATLSLQFRSMCKCG